MKGRNKKVEIEDNMLSETKLFMSQKTQNIISVIFQEWFVPRKPGKVVVFLPSSMQFCENVRIRKSE